MKIEFETDNAAFVNEDESSGAADDEAGAGESARILRQVADKIEEGYTSGVCIDANGNTVGSWSA